MARESPLQGDHRGHPDQVASELEALASAHGVDEVMVNTLTSDSGDRLISYRLLAERLTH
ncbi:MAG: hypothetical protein R2722_01860 [Tessaracoccus sp.]